MLGHRAVLTLQCLASVERQRSVSAQLQRSLLPRLPHCDWLDLFASYVPAHGDDEVGGDRSDAFLLAHDVAAVIRHELRACAWRDAATA
jgi:serine phosphatase RsbU (regulator of sigma subunit)